MYVPGKFYCVESNKAANFTPVVSLPSISFSFSLATILSLESKDFDLSCGAGVIVRNNCQ